MEATEQNSQAVRLQKEGRLLEAIDLYKESQTGLESRYGGVHSLVAQSLHNRASACRALGVYDEAERLFQLAIQIWVRQGWPTPAETTGPDWAESFDERLQLREFGKQVRTLRAGVERGDKEAMEMMTQTLQRLGPWYHNVEFAKGVESNPANRDYPMSRWRILNEVIPKDLKQQSVLDIGCNSGFFFHSR